jgi:hypothetical protein
MDLSWITNRSLQLSPRARVVDEAAEEALRRKRQELAWQPENGFLKDQFAERRDTALRRVAGFR